MTAPAGTNTNDQILIKLGEMSAQLAVISEQLKAVPDHESRLRIIEAAMPQRLEDRVISLETSRAKLLGLSVTISLVASGGGTWLGLIIAHH